MSGRLKQASARLTTWLRQDALPLWATSGIDVDTGASRERLLPDGSPDADCDHRVLVQARQIFAYALAHHLGWYPDAGAIATGIQEFAERTCVNAGDRCGYVHLLDRRLEVVDHQPRLYDQVFFLLAHAWCYRALGSAVALARAAALAAHLDQTFGAPNGGWRDGSPGALRRQNPHMHLLEAFLALYDATGNRCWLERCDTVFHLFECHFFDSGHGVVLEYFHDDWTPLTVAEGQVVEPGHMLEWVWLLYSYGVRSGTDVDAPATTLYERAREIGRCPRSGLLFDAVTPDGRVLARSKRCWPLTEQVKAGVARASAGFDDAADHAAEVIGLLFEYYLCAPTPGAWVDQRGAANEIAVAVAPASTLYHLMLAAAEAARWCEAERT